ncbi:hypothetical protein VTN77DRAFT_1238 [Rasamsonia byssochlamydoides]|uniref:uncharacterized protein n=1 Tax=Rasamsonia byssochlamydoides TaxID=89139 RepID=UPI003742FB5C
MASLFKKRLRCFYCGKRSAEPTQGTVRKWRCKNCEAVNYLDENGEITDPPTAATNPHDDGSDASTPFNSIDFDQSGLFCRKCVRNQHLFMKALGSYLPDPDDPAYPAYEREYPKFRKNLEERYPQVCENCEARVNQRIRQAGYEAKADHLRRMMERSKASRAARKARNRNWRSLLVFAGAVGHWASVAGQLAWSFVGAIEDVSFDKDSPWSSFVSLTRKVIGTRQVESHDLAPYAGVALILGILSLWWNPKLRLKVEGRSGRFVGLGQYYQFQLIVLVTRFVLWALLKDPATSGMKPSLPPTLHIFMMVFMIMGVIISRQIVQYDTRPLVLWSDTPVASPSRKAQSTQANTNDRRQVFQDSSAQRFPVEKLAMPRQTPDKPSPIPSTPPPEEDTMDWTPSLKQEIRPKFSVAQENHGEPFAGKSPFYGSLPEAPKPPSWQLRNPIPQRPVEKVVERNPFHRAPMQSPEQENRAADKGSGRGSDVYFAPPKFFPPSDYSATTGLETLFDQAFTIRSPDDEPSDHAGSSVPPASINAQKSFVYQCLRLALLIACLIMWQVSQMELVSIPGNYVEIASLGSASLIAGFALLEILKQPMNHWNSMEILVSLAELAAAIHLGGNLPRIFYEREYFDRYGKSLLVFMSAQEMVGLSSSYQQARSSSNATAATTSGQLQTAPSSSQAADDSRHDSQSQSFSSAPSSPPALSFSSTLGGSSFSQPSLSHSQSSPPHYSLYRHDLDKDNDNDSDTSEASGVDSDAETTLTSATNRTIRHMNPFAVSKHPDPSPTKGRAGLGSGLRGLRLDDSPGGRVTRSQAPQAGGDLYRRYPLRRNR